MLAGSKRFAVGGIRFELGDIADFAERSHVGALDVVFANASLQWVTAHRELLRALSVKLASGGQLAFQVPANHNHASHRVASEIAGEPPFADALAGAPTRGKVLAPEEYADLLDRLGYAEQHVRLQVYGHHLAATSEVVEWVKGTLLTPYREGLEPELYDQFVARYRSRLLEELGDRQPYFYPFKRILCWARRS